MASRKVVSLARSSHWAEGAGQQYGPLASERLRPLLTPVLRPGETVPDVGLLMDLFGRVLERDRLELAHLDRQHARDRRHGRLLRRQRDERKAALRARLIKVRILARGFLGTSKGDLLLGLEGRISRDAVFLLQQTRFAVTGLEQAAAGEWEAQPEMNATIDFAYQARWLQEAATRLEETLQALTGSGREAILAMAAQREGYAAQRADLAKVFRLFEALLTAADMPLVAKSVRGRKRRKAGEEDEPDQESRESQDDGENPSS